MRKLILLVLVSALSFAWAQTQFQYATLEWTENAQIGCTWLSPTQRIVEDTCTALYLSLTGETDTDTPTPLAFQLALNYLGEEGWDLVTAINFEAVPVIQYVFKRQLP